jgi:hypothetical protein
MIFFFEIYNLLFGIIPVCDILSISDCMLLFPDVDEMFELPLQWLENDPFIDVFSSLESRLRDGGRDLFRLEEGLLSSDGRPLGVDIESDDLEDDVEDILELFRILLLRIKIFLNYKI